jgi:uncharacterized protein YqgC (DUF456 family)
VAQSEPILWITLAVMLVGLLGSVLPALPGVPLIFLSALVYSFLTGFEFVGTLVLVVLFVFALLAFVADFVGTAYGARRFGASNWGTAGGAVGGLVGGLAGALFFGVGALFGLILGSVGGVFLGEYLRRHRQGTQSSAGTQQPRIQPARSDPGDWGRTGRAAGGVFVGYLISAAAQGVLGLVSVVVFILALIY